MTYSISDAFRAELAARARDFHRTVDSGVTTTPLKRSAVAITVVEDDDGSGDACFLLTKRVPKLKAHSGQWALPGGRCDEGESAIETALREMQEEIGLTLGADAVLGVLDDYPTRSGYAITPVVVWGGAGVEVNANPDEVASIHRIKLDRIAAEDALEFVTIPESDRQVIRLKITERFVHAPTAAMLYQFIEMVQGRETRVADYEQPVFAWK